MKAQLRRHIRAARAGRVPSRGFAQRVLAHIPAGSTVCCYVALPGEPPTDEVIEALLARGDRVFLPVVAASGPDLAASGPDLAASGVESTTGVPARQQNRLGWVPAADSRPWQAWGVGSCPPPPTAPTPLPEPDVIIVPALAVDASGRRLGQGGGYYDRFVPLHPTAHTIALLWSGEVLPDVGAQPHDITVAQWVIADE